MGLFNRRAEAREREQQQREAEEQRQAAEAADPLAPMKRQFAGAVARGRLDDASSTLNAYLADHPSDSGPADYEHGPSLLEQAAPVRRALAADQTDQAVELLIAWEIRPPHGSITEIEARMAELPNLNTIGMLLVDFFSRPDATAHPAYATLLDTQLMKVAKYTRLSMPRPEPGGYFDRVYAELKSNWELSRAAARAEQSQD